jgi:RNA polymerase sigma factor (TIGR02999 family)
MVTTPASDITRLLREAASNGEAADELLRQVYETLRAIAHRRMAGENPGITLQATVLVHDAYVKLMANDHIEWRDRVQFYGAAAESMRRILIDHARAKGRAKRGGEHRRIALSVVDLAFNADSDQIVAVDEAIRRLGNWDARLGELVRLRFFAGLGVAETAEAMGISERTVQRDWELARGWLHRELRRSEGCDKPDQNQGDLPGGR